MFLIKQQFSLVLLLVQNYPSSKQKYGKESCFADKWIKAEYFALFHAVIGYISSNHDVCFIKN